MRPSICSTCPDPTGAPWWSSSSTRVAFPASVSHRTTSDVVCRDTDGRDAERGTWTWRRAIIEVMRSRTIVVGAGQLGPVEPEHSRADVVERLIALLRAGAERGCQLVVFPELALTTFFPRW